MIKANHILTIPNYIMTLTNLADPHMHTCRRRKRYQHKENSETPVRVLYFHTQQLSSKRDSNPFELIFAVIKKKKIKSFRTWYKYFLVFQTWSFFYYFIFFIFGFVFIIVVSTFILYLLPTLYQ